MGMRIHTLGAGTGRGRLLLEREDQRSASAHGADELHVAAVCAFGLSLLSLPIYVREAVCPRFCAFGPYG